MILTDAIACCCSDAVHGIPDWSIEWNPALVAYAYPDTVPQNLVAFSQVVFLFAAACFNFVVQMGNLLAEKELKLRQVWSAGMQVITHSSVTSRDQGASP